MALIASILSRKPVQVALVAAGYFALAHLGLSLAFATTQVTAIWPPTGLALAALVLMGPRAALGIFLGAFAANARASEPLGVAAGIALGNTAAGLAGWWILRRVRLPRPAFAEVREVAVLGVIAAATPLLSASGGVSCLMLGGLVPASAFGSVWRVWWMGDSLGLLLITPLFLTWSAPSTSLLPGRRRAEALLLSASVIAIGLLVFCGGLESSGLHLRAYAGFPLLIWAALRFGPRMTATTTVAISCFAVWGATRGHGPFGLGSLDERLLQLGAFLGVTGITSLLMGAVTAERQEAQRRLSAAHADLERKVEARTAALAAANADLGRKHEEVEASRRFLETIVEHLPVALVVKSARAEDFGSVELWNPTAERIFGVSRATASGRTPAEFLDAEEGARVMAKDREVAAGGEVLEVGDGVFHVPTLGPRHLRTTLVPLRGNDGAVERILTLSMDVTERWRAEDALKQSERLHRLIVESLSEGVILRSQDGSVFQCNARAEEILGLGEEEIRDYKNLGRTWQLLQEDGAPMPPEGNPAQIALRTGEPLDGAVVGIQKRDGTLGWIRVNAHPIHLVGEPGCVVVSFSDFTLEKYYRDSLLKSEERYVLATKGGHTGILDLDLKANTVFYSDNWKAMLGYGAGDIGNRPEELLGRIHPDDLVPALETLRAHIRGETPEFRCELRIQHKNGDWIWLLSRGLAVRDTQGHALRVTGSQTDITAQKALEAKLYGEATRDELTGLYNRRHFNEAFESFMGTANSHGHALSLAVCDLDRFKQINDTYGHPAGDEVIRRFAANISGILRGKDLAARVGGDEFCILFPFTTAAEAAIGLERLRVGLGEESFVGPEGQAFKANATFGVAELVPGMSRDELMKSADDALYEAKRRGRNQVVVNAPEGS